MLLLFIWTKCIIFAPENFIKHYLTEMKHVSSLLCAAILSISLMCGCTKRQDIRFGDPFILAASDGRYYMYGTSMADGFEAYSSDNLMDWTSCGRVYQGASEGQWNQDCFWAPEVYERGGKYYMFFSANDRNNPTHEGENFKIGVAVADSPTGPFTDLYNRPVFNPPYPIIDANVWFDDATGRCYLYFSRCCYKHPVESDVATWARNEGLYDTIEESWIYGVELMPDFSGVIGEPQLLLQPPVHLADPATEWENRSVLAHEAGRRWNEGSFAIRNDSLYYIMYSANFFGSSNYAVGYATGRSPLGPFTKAAENPILQADVAQGGHITGTGHNMAFRSHQGEWLTVFHGRTLEQPDERVVFISPIEIDPSGRLVIHHSDKLTLKPQYRE